MMSDDTKWSFFIGFSMIIADVNYRHLLVVRRFSLLSQYYLYMRRCPRQNGSLAFSLLLLFPFAFPRTVFPYGVYQRVGRVRKWDKHDSPFSWSFLFLQTPNNECATLRDKIITYSFREMRTSKSMLNVCRIEWYERASEIEPKPRKVGGKIIDK